MAESLKVSHKKGLGLMAERKHGWEEGKGREGKGRLSLIHISEPTRPPVASRMPSSA